MILLDANIFISFLSGDDPARVADCLALFERVESGESARTLESIVAEVIYVLSSPRQYRWPRSVVVERFRPLVELEALEIPDKWRVLRALDIFASSVKLDIADCLLLADLEGNADLALASYDRDFDGIPGVRRADL